MHYFRKCGRWNDKFFPRHRLPLCDYKCELYYLRCTHETEDMYELMCLQDEPPKRLETMGEYTGKKDLKRCTSATNLFEKSLNLALIFVTYYFVHL